MSVFHVSCEASYLKCSSEGTKILMTDFDACKDRLFVHKIHSGRVKHCFNYEIYLFTLSQPVMSRCPQGKFTTGSEMSGKICHGAKLIRDCKLSSIDPL